MIKELEMAKRPENEFGAVRVQSRRKSKTSVRSRLGRDEVVVATCHLNGDFLRLEGGRRNVARWLRKLAKDVMDEGEGYSRTFRARNIIKREQN